MMGTSRAPRAGLMLASFALALAAALVPARPEARQAAAPARQNLQAMAAISQAKNHILKR